MTSIAKIPVVWTGTTGLPGVSVFYSTAADAVAAVAALNTFFAAIAGLFPTGLQWSTPSNGDVVQDTDGLLVNSWTGGAGTVISASGGAGAYAAGVGCRVTWGTNTIVGRRRLKGSTFLVPLLGSSYDSGGTILSTTLATLNTATTAVVTANKNVVWARPSKGGSDGVSAPVTSRTIKDQIAVLRSRRT